MKKTCFLLLILLLAFSVDAQTNHKLEKPTLHLLSFGTNPSDLNYTMKDAQDFATLFEHQDNGKGLFKLLKG